MTVAKNPFRKIFAQTTNFEQVYVFVPMIFTFGEFST